MLHNDCDQNCTQSKKALALEQGPIPFCGVFVWSFFELYGFSLGAVRHASQLNWKLYIYYVSVFADEYRKQPWVFLPDACWDGGIIEAYGSSSYTKMSLFSVGIIRREWIEVSLLFYS